MPTSILVAYATRYGSTQEVAEAAAATMRERGLDVDLLPAAKVRSLDTYRAVVLGAPLYMFRWHADAHRFLSRLRKALTPPGGPRVAVFGMGPWHADPKEMQDARGQLDKELAKHAWFRPAAVEVFGGKFDPARLDFPYSLIGPLKKMPAADVRDWAAISTWAGGLAAALLNPAP